ncbi:unnamed protein product [Heligmosomoides polygyrus]|uniref:Transposase n=1 Tax=Heligmosomoides polygyrus TaxID=6339 RepID=A0A183F302_HELPZ|nr:unnamed protein product [Heligmosomoides polygyrus]
MYGIDGATARYEATLIGGKLDDIANTSIYNSLEDFHAVREPALLLPYRDRRSCFPANYQGVRTQHVKVLRELYSGFTTKLSPCYNGIVINVRESFWQEDTTPKTGLGRWTAAESFEDEERKSF